MSTSLVKAAAQLIMHLGRHSRVCLTCHLLLNFNVLLFLLQLELLLLIRVGVLDDVHGRHRPRRRRLHLDDPLEVKRSGVGQVVPHDDGLGRIGHHGFDRWLK